MADIDYAAKAATATKLLQKFGGPITLRQTIQGEYDPDTGQVGQEIIDWPTFGAKFNYVQDHIDGTLIQRSDQELYMAAENIPPPTTAYQVIVGTKTYPIITVQAVEPYNVPLLYILQIRG